MVDPFKLLIQASGEYNYYLERPKFIAVLLEFLLFNFFSSSFLVTEILFVYMV